jgi:hypothetical protein
MVWFLLELLRAVCDAGHGANQADALDTPPATGGVRFRLTQIRGSQNSTRSHGKNLVDEKRIIRAV